MARKTFMLAFGIMAVLSGCSSRKKLEVVMISGSNYDFSYIGLTRFQEHLAEICPQWTVTLLQADSSVNPFGEFSRVPGPERLFKADVIVLFTRRLTPGDGMGKIKEAVLSGKPVVALRSTSHGFQGWLDFDREILGGNYHGQYPGSPELPGKASGGMPVPAGEPVGPVMQVKISDHARLHPLLGGVENFTSPYSLYMTSPVAPGVDVLMTGEIPGNDPEPVVWTYNTERTRSVYIGLGGLMDWENPMFRRLVTNAVKWAASGKRGGINLPEG